MADIAQRGDEGLSQKALADMTGIDRDHVVAALRQIFESKVARTHIDRRRPDHRNGLHAAQNFADVIVGVGVMVHFKKSIRSLRGANGPGLRPTRGLAMTLIRLYLSCHFGSRFSMKAPMPSSASRAIMFSVITSAA